MKTLTLFGLAVIALHTSVPAFVPPQETAGESPRSPRAVAAHASRSAAAPQLRKSAAPHPRLSLLAAVARSEDGEASRPTTAAQPSIPEPWASLADCESGEWDRNGVPIPGTATWDATAGIHEGGLQFAPSTWDWLRPDHYPDAAYDATPAQQIFVAERVLEVQGWKAWPVCSVKVGLR